MKKNFKSKTGIILLSIGLLFLCSLLNTKPSVNKKVILPTVSSTPIISFTPTATLIPTMTPLPTVDIGNKVDAGIMCERFVTDRLKAPSTTDFGGVFSNRTESMFVEKDNLNVFSVDESKIIYNTGAWIVTGSVDAQNSFGAIIRSKFYCVLDYDIVNGRWYLIDIMIE